LAQSELLDNALKGKKIKMLKRKKDCDEKKPAEQ
jgi:hypothetical protein